MVESGPRRSPRSVKLKSRTPSPKFTTSSYNCLRPLSMSTQRYPTEGEPKRRYTARLRGGLSSPLASLSQRPRDSRAQRKMRVEQAERCMHLSAELGIAFPFEASCGAICEAPNGRKTDRSSSRESPYDTAYRRPGKMPRVPGYGRAGRCYDIPDRAHALPTASRETCWSIRAARDSSCIPQYDWPDVQRRMGRLSRYGTGCRSRCGHRGGQNDSGCRAVYGSRCSAGHLPPPCDALGGQKHYSPLGDRSSTTRAFSAAASQRASPENVAHDSRYTPPT